jgi:hypothetical protein
MPIFKSPVFSKQVNAKGQTEVSYIFPIQYAPTDHVIESVAESTGDLTVESIQNLLKDNNEWWHGFLGDFLKQSATFFSKQYPVEEIRKLVRHTIIHDSDITSPVTVTLVPKHIHILQGIFTIHWMYTSRPIVIDIPGLSDPLPDPNKVADDVAELNIDELPIENPTESLELEDSTKLYQKQKVKEAILRAKVAYYRAQNQIRTFSDKYGDEYSDSEFELEDTENESEEDQ